ncbi:MAG: M81 family metallopeptidase [Gemmataceae bacterium]|nr:M81 family metallopeptidase [Gemmataceae bacterium]
MPVSCGSYGTSISRPIALVLAPPTNPWRKSIDLALEREELLDQARVAVETHNFHNTLECLHMGLSIAAALDHHANMTQRMVDCANALIGHETQPHDPPATGRKAAWPRASASWVIPFDPGQPSTDGASSS